MVPYKNPWITVSTLGTNCKFWVVPRKKLGLQLVPRVLTADFDQRVVVLLKFSEMQLVLMVSKINILPPPVLMQSPSQTALTLLSRS